MKKKFEFSKIICIITLTIFLIECIVSKVFAFLGISTEIFIYTIPSCGTIVAACISFYLAKAKAENISKQKLRTVLVKNVLLGKIDEDTYQEISQELDNLEETLDMKMNSMYSDAVEEDSTVNL